MSWSSKIVQNDESSENIAVPMKKIVTIPRPIENEKKKDSFLIKTLKENLNIDFDFTKLLVPN
jgi:hypothetical protein